MTVKWRGVTSSMRDLHGGGPQGALWGILEYLSQTNNNTDYICPSKKFKFIDDLSILEIVNLLSIGLSSYNFHQHVASDIPSSGFYIDPVNMRTKQYLEKITDWTEENKLNTKKSKAMVFNFTNDYQFGTKMMLDNQELEEIQETKLLGVIINNKLNWDSNTDFLVKKSNAKMWILHKLVDFQVPKDDLKIIYFLYIRSHLEQSCQVWHSSLTLENTKDIERVQKNALRIILQDDYNNYPDALETRGLESLYDRRETLCLRFATKCIKSENSVINNMFPLSYAQATVTTRKPDKFHVNMVSTGRYKKSAMPFMQRLLNSDSDI